MTKILLLRHAQSEWNVLGRWQGAGADPELTQEGENQAKNVSNLLNNIEIFYSSPLKRALNTAKIICQNLNVAAPKIANNMIERDAGEWTGLTREEIEEKWPNYLDQGKRPEHFESTENLTTRVMQNIISIAEENESTVCIVTHAGVIGRVIEYLNNVQHNNFMQRVTNCQGWWLNVDAETQEVTIEKFFEGYDEEEADNTAL